MGIYYVSPMFSSENSVVLALSLVFQFELIFVYGVRSESNFIILHVDYFQVLYT